MYAQFLTIFFRPKTYPSGWIPPPLPSAVVLLLLLLPSQDGVTVTLSDMELFSRNNVKLFALTKATRTPGGNETVWMESVHFQYSQRWGTDGLNGGNSPRMKREGPVDGMMGLLTVCRIKKATLKAYLPGQLRLLLTQKWTTERIRGPDHRMSQRQLLLK